MNKRQLPGRMFAVAVAAGVAGTIAWGLRAERVPVESRPVRRGHLAVRVRDDGITRVKERYTVSAPLAGRMQRVDLHVGDPVYAGTTRITSITPTDPVLLDPRAEAEARARVAAARAAQRYTEQAIHRAELVEEYAAADLARARELYPTKAVTHEQLDAAERSWRTAVEEVEEAAEALNIAIHIVTLLEAALLRSTTDGPPGGHDAGAPAWRMDIHSPVHGRVLRVFREQAGPIDVGAEILEMGDPGDLEVVIDLVSADAVKVTPGDRCELTAWGGSHPLAGHVRVVEPRGFTKVSPLGVEEQRVNVIVDIDVPPTDSPALGDGFHLEAAITVNEADDVVLVPLAALFGHGEGEAVFIIDGTTARLVPVVTGRRGDREAEVVAGLSGGERVIAYPSDKVADGVPLTVR
jgi:HlyD family secretion protein